jgi:hypothetical protein
LHPYSSSPQTRQLACKEARVYSNAEIARSQRGFRAQRLTRVSSEHFENPLSVPLELSAAVVIPFLVGRDVPSAAISR